jgi:phosphonate transport system substrate-binding protein
VRSEPPRRAAAAPRRRRTPLLLLVAVLLVTLAWPPARAAAVADGTAGAVGAAGAPAVAEGRAGDEGYTFGVFPYLPPLSIDRIFAPIVGGISREIGRPVHLRTKPSFEAFTAELSVAGYDLAFMHPFLYVEEAAGYGYVPLVRIDEPLRVLFLARTDARLAELRDIAGRTLALPGPLSAVSEMTRLALVELGLRPGTDVQLQHHQTKLACVQAVVLGAAAACGLPSFALAQIEVGKRQGFRVFDERSVPVGLLVAASPRLPEAERRRLAAAAVAWSATPEGRAVMAEEGWPGFAPGVDQDFEPVRAMIARSHHLAFQR